MVKLDPAFFKNSITDVVGLQHEETESHHTVTFTTPTIMGNPSVVVLLSRASEYAQHLKDFDIDLHEMRGVGTRVTLRWSKDDPAMAGS